MLWICNGDSGDGDDTNFANFHRFPDRSAPRVGNFILALLNVT